MNRGLIRAAPASLTIIFAISACASGDGAGSTDAAVGDATQREASLLFEAMFGDPDVANPALDSYMRERHREQELAVDECMEEQGYEYTQETYEANPERGTTDLSLVADLLEADPVRPADDEVADPDYAMALHGSGGCYESGTQRSTEAQSVFFAYSEQIQDLWTAVDADRRVVDAESKWSTCMSESGYEFESRPEMLTWWVSRVEQAPNRSALEQMVDEERLLRTSVLACDEERDRVRAEVLREYKADFDDKYQVAIVEEIAEVLRDHERTR